MTRNVVDARGSLIGFTGTREGMSISQSTAFEALMSIVDHGEFHHGGCVGADEEASLIVQRVLHPVHLVCPVTCHPPEQETHRSKKAYYGRLLGRKPYLERNHDIVDSTLVLIATPKEFVEELRSGTWATVRYARKKGKTIFIIYCDGKISTELPQENINHIRV